MIYYNVGIYEPAGKEDAFVMMVGAARFGELLNALRTIRVPCFAAIVAGPRASGTIIPSCMGPRRWMSSPV